MHIPWMNIDAHRELSSNIHRAAHDDHIKCGIVGTRQKLHL
jgi:hypothetical protein